MRFFLSVSFLYGNLGGNCYDAMLSFEKGKEKVVEVVIAEQIFSIDLDIAHS